MCVTHLNENRAHSNLLEHRKDLLANISTFDEKDKKSCLTWINQVEHAANHAQVPLRQMIAAKAGPVVSAAINDFIRTKPDATNAQVKQWVLEHFSNVGTKTEAFHYLGEMKVEDDESLLAHNAEYGAVHEVAYEIPPERQENQRTLSEYAKSLPDTTLIALTRKIVRDNTKIFTLKQAMDAAIKIHKQARQEEITRLERSTMRETTVTDVNEMSLSEEVNFMPRGDNRFNSTMRSNSGRWNNSPRGRNSYNQGNRYNSYSDNNQGNRYNSYPDNNQGNRNNSYPNNNQGNRYNSYSDNGGNKSNQYSDNRSWNNSRSNYPSNYDSRRKLRRYSHQPRDLKSNVAFEYNINDRNMLPNLRRAVDSLKGETQDNRNRYKKFVPRMSQRSEEEVHEDAIAEVQIGKIQEILKEDIELIFDALVMQDYIDEVDA